MTNIIPNGNPRCESQTCNKMFCIALCCIGAMALVAAPSGGKHPAKASGKPSLAARAPARPAAELHHATRTPARPAAAPHHAARTPARPAAAPHRPAAPHHAARPAVQSHHGRPRGVFYRGHPPAHYRSWRRGPRPHAIYRSGWYDDVWYDEDGYPYYDPSVAAGVAIGTAVAALAGAETTTVVAQPAVVQQPVVVQQPAVVQQPVVVQQPAVVQQPVVVQQQPVVQQTVPAPVASQPRWVEGRYVDQMQDNGTTVRVWQPGHYEQ